VCVYDCVCGAFTPDLRNQIAANSYGMNYCANVFVNIPDVRREGALVSQKKPFLPFNFVVGRPRARDSKRRWSKLASSNSSSILESD